MPKQLILVSLKLVAKHLQGSVNFKQVLRRCAV